MMAALGSITADAHAPRTDVCALHGPVWALRARCCHQHGSNLSDVTCHAAPAIAPATTIGSRR